MMKGAGSTDYDEIKRLNAERDVLRVSAGQRSSVEGQDSDGGRVLRHTESSSGIVDQGKQSHGQPDPLEGYQDWHSIVGDDDLEDNPNT